MAEPLALVGGAVEVDRLGLAAERERVAVVRAEVADGDDDARVAALREQISRRRPVLLTAPFAAGLDGAAALLELTATATAPVGYAEPVLVSPVGETGLARCGALDLRRLDLSWRAPGGDPAVESARAAALALAVLGGGDLPHRGTDGSWRGEVDGADIEVEVSTDHPLTDWSLQAVATEAVVRLEWAPHPGVEVDGAALALPGAPTTALTASGADDAGERLLIDLGYRAVVAGITGAAAGRGGAVVPLGFARRVVAACVG